MLQITPQHKLFIAVMPIDFRSGIDGIKILCKHQWDADPFHGHVFVFRNRNRTAIKILTYDGNGFWLAHKRFSQGKLKWWPQTAQEASAVRAIDLLVMLQQGSPLAVHVPADWRRLPVSQVNLGNSTVATNLA